MPSIADFHCISYKISLIWLHMIGRIREDYGFYPVPGNKLIQSKHLCICSHFRFYKKNGCIILAGGS
jgi:hypothetical protein